MSARELTAPSVWTPEELTRLKTFITSELRKIVSNEEYLKKLTSESAMEVWSSAFTHSSVSSITTQNYEWLETLGDAYLKAIFLSYIDSLLTTEQRTPGYFTDLVRFWLSKQQLNIFSKELGFPAYLKARREVLEDPDPLVRSSLNEDIFEAFFGALVTLGDRNIAEGVGYAYARKYLVKFFTGKQLLLSEQEIFPVKTKLKELFGALQWGDVVYIVVKDTGSEVTVRIPEGSIGNQIPISKRTTLAIGRGENKQAAEQAAASNAMKALEENDITAETIAANRPIDHEIERLKDRISNYINKYGNYGPLEFIRIYKNKNIFVVEVRTTQDYETAKARKVRLSEGTGSSNRDARITALKNYIASHKIP